MWQTCSQPVVPLSPLGVGRAGPIRSSRPSAAGAATPGPEWSPGTTPSARPTTLSTVGQADNLDAVAVQRSKFVPGACVSDSTHGQVSTGSNNGVSSRCGYHWWMTTADDEAAY